MKAAEAWAPGMVTTDVGGINENRSYLAFLGQRYERMGGGEKTSDTDLFFKIYMTKSCNFSYIRCSGHN